MPFSFITVSVSRVASVMKFGGLTDFAQGLSLARELFRALTTASTPSC